MDETTPACPACNSPHSYQDRNLWVCGECFHEWLPQAVAAQPVVEAPRFRDANGNPLVDGDTVTTVKDLKVGKDTLKAGTKVKGIRLLDEPVDGHDISCKVDGFGSLYLKCSVVKKAK